MSTVPRRLGKYELQGRLGRGGMAEVWKAFDTQLERYVAIKILRADLQNDPDFMKRFVREAQVVASLHHPNIVQVHDFQTAPPELDHTSAYMVMDYIEGQTLTEYIRDTARVGNFPQAAEIVHLFSRMCSAVDYAHHHGMIHRDIKPANILLDTSRSSRYEMGTPFLTDFGIVKLVGTSTVTQSGWWLGTPLYISPEQAQGLPGTEQSDIYSLGVILYEICTGVRPFQGENIASIIMQHINATPTQPALINPKITPALTDVIMRCLAKDPAARFHSASSLATALRDAFNVANSASPISLAQAADAMNRSIDPGLLVSDQPLTAIELPSSSPPHSKVPFASQFPESSNIVHNTPMTPTGITPDQLPSELSPSSIPVSRTRQRSLIVTLIVLLVGSSLGTFYWLAHKQSSAPIGTALIVGQAFFISSGQMNETYTEGVNDELKIDLHNIPETLPGKSYYAWLLSDEGTSPQVAILLGRLPLDRGNAQFLYMGDSQHTNLIGITSRFLITEANTNPPQSNPFLNQDTWRYYAELPQIRSSIGLHQRAIDTLRGLLSDNSDLSQGLYGGSDIHLFINTKKVLDWADSALAAEESKNPVTIRDQVVRILDYLDGTSLVQQDVPPGTALLVEPTLGYVPLLDLKQNQELASYVDRMNYELTGLANPPGVTSRMLQLATEADDALLNNVVPWLEQIHRDAKQLVNMTNTQLLLSSTLSILNDMEVQASYAYNGWIDPSTSVLKGGVVWIHNHIQSLVTFDVKPYSSK